MLIASTDMDFRLFRILTGAAAAQCHPERQYLVARLMQFGFSIGLEEGEDFKRKR